MYYTVRINTEYPDGFKLVDFSKVKDGIISLKCPRDLHVIKGQDQSVRWNFSINSFVNGSESVGIIFFNTSGLLNGVYKSLYLKNNRVKGYVDNLIIKMGISNTAPSSMDSVDIPYGTDLFSIKFITKEYNDLVLEKKANGIQSSPVNIDVFVNGKFKPYSSEQALSRGLSLVASSHKDGCKFYERDYVDNALSSDAWIDGGF